MKKNENTKVVAAEKKFFTEERKAMIKDGIKDGLKFVGTSFLSGCIGYLGLMAMGKVCTSFKSHGGHVK